MLPSEIEVLEYLDPAGCSPFAAWFNHLNARAAAKVAISIAKLARGNFSNAKGVGSGWWSTRLISAPVIAFISVEMENASSSFSAAAPSIGSRMIFTMRKRGG